MKGCGVEEISRQLVVRLLDTHDLPAPPCLPPALCEGCSTPSLSPSLINSFVFDCAPSLLLCSGFSLAVESLGSSCDMPASHCGGFSCCGSRVLGLSSCGPWTLERRPSSCDACLGFVAPRHVGSSQIRDGTCLSCIGRQILYH